MACAASGCDGSRCGQKRVTNLVADGDQGRRTWYDGQTRSVLGNPMGPHARWCESGREQFSRRQLGQQTPPASGFGDSWWWSRRKNSRSAVISENFVVDSGNRY